MSPPADLSALYSRPIILWVEDHVTSTYLGDCWNDSDIAFRMVWWMACRRVLADLRAEFLMDFPAHSRVNDLASAERHICGSDWYQRLRDYNRTVIPATQITHRLTAAHGTTVAALSAGDWRQTFSGKELLHALHGWLYTPPAGGATAPAEMDRDLARSIASWQVAQGEVPAEIAELRTALRTRVGI